MEPEREVSLSTGIRRKPRLVLVFLMTGALCLTLSPASLGQDQEQSQRRMRTMRPAAAPATADSVEQVPFFDGHVHLNDPDMQLELMEMHGIPKAIVTWGRNSTNATVREAAAAHPERLISFVSVAPERQRYRTLWDSEDPALLTLLENELKTGVFRGIGEISGPTAQFGRNGCR